MTVKEKLAALRLEMERNEVDAYIVFQNDPHISEYVPDYWKEREWMSGFTGSAGTLVVTADEAALWTDSRYFIQADEQLAESGIELCKMGIPEVPEIPAWIAMRFPNGAKVACNGRVISINSARALNSALKKYGIKCSFKYDLINKIWSNRPSLPKEPVFIHQLSDAKRSVQEKLGAIRKLLLVNNATGYLMCALDEICWAFNIRGADIEYNPVTLSYAWVDQDSAILFIDPDKLSDEVVQFLKEERIDVKKYGKVDKFLEKLDKKTAIAIDPAKTNWAIKKAIPKKVRVIECAGLATVTKNRKTKDEIDGIREAMLQDGIAMVRFLHWLETSVGNETVTELSVAAKLKELRGLGEKFVGESFGAIVGYREHGAIVHYCATEQTNSTIYPEGFLLVDSGGQYLNGTTDITRTVHLGNPSPDEMHDYTLVLKGMIRLSMAKFPAGTRGSQLDTLARMDMWANGLNYGHGTGHGVGYFLNVHEGPQQIRPENHMPIEPGMVMSNEPGIYRAGKHGIRIENLIVCREWESNPFGRFLHFDTLTLCPIDTKPVKVDMLNQQEREWLNAYHRKVYELLAPLLNTPEKEWLRSKTAPVRN